ncbi:hypothetical protein DRN75_04200, partial [Nanoarchaeota archaeon]
RFLESPTARLLSSWCLDYYAKYGNAPKRDIEGIFAAQMKGLDRERVEDISEILSGLSHEYERGQFNFQYLLDQTYRYFQERNLRIFTENVTGEIVSGHLKEAERLASSYRPVEAGQVNSIDPFSSASKIKEAFAERQKPLVRFGKALGRFLNQEMVRDAFVAFMGKEKSGKTWLLIEIAMRANRSGCNVAFFQAGDMSESQYILRQSIYLTKRPHKEKYCSGVWVPVLDCKRNQFDECNKEERESLVGVFERDEEVNYESLQAAYKNNPDYKPCRNCKDIEGTPWLVPCPSVAPLSWKEAYKAAKKWRKRYKKQFRLSTYANETLSVFEIKAVLDVWERSEEFIPDVIIIDYADLLTSDPDTRGLDFRNRQNVIWQRLRALSQQRHCLVVTATQAAASSYGKRLISMSDFSEDKRKYAHVTAMYGLNQTDEEKRLGVMRINQIVVREDDFSTSKPVHVLQRLQIGRPVLESY